MADYITLLGAEDVRAAAARMEAAASSMARSAEQIDYAMSRHANNFSETLEQHHQWMDGWLERFKKIIDASDMPEPEPAPVEPPHPSFTPEPLQRMPPSSGTMYEAKDDDDIPF